ncbi:winged helix-turn-helix transcriptional regulator [Micromonospora chaiyaphumensis]|uniref:Transcriptional regulator, HxlR family n=1 Tax=Micromonospora chaiyaphumensis TaxID=307119 RepID=A0A1C4Y2T0_9ACTN|nr:helix-turn-helix domain-containing protein [Micromonospora chaiyaphumensis]SCF14681.1 transcriptional regulator, HxlR family [Micromonospora chaiyaphumensis]
MTHQTVGHDGVDLRRLCSGPDARPDPSCPVEVTLAALRGRWTALVIGAVARGPHSFTDLAHALPALSDKVLTDRLLQLTAAGVIARHRTASWPPRVTYTLTGRGRELLPVLRAMWDWGAAEAG